MVCHKCCVSYPYSWFANGTIQPQEETILTAHNNTFQDNAFAVQIRGGLQSSGCY